MEISKEQLVRIMPFAKSRVDAFLPHINAAMKEFGINTPERVAAFLAQVGHESAQLRYVKELASGSAYEGRKDLGNTQAGDGVKYKGRGLIQITGRVNYVKVMMALGIDCVECPALLEQPVNACRASAWWWNDHSLNEIADACSEPAFRKITKIVNGGYNGWDDRLALYNKAKDVLCSQK